MLLLTRFFQLDAELSKSARLHFFQIFEKFCKFHANKFFFNLVSCLSSFLLVKHLQCLLLKTLYFKFNMIINIYPFLKMKYGCLIKTCIKHGLKLSVIYIVSFTALDLTHT